MHGIFELEAHRGDVATTVFGFIKLICMVDLHDFGFDAMWPYGRQQNITYTAMHRSNHRAEGSEAYALENIHVQEILTVAAMFLTDKLPRTATGGFASTSLFKFKQALKLQIRRSAEMVKL